MRTSLDTPFLFILEIKDFSAQYLTKDSDLVSTWGHLALQHTPNAPSVKNVLLEDLTQIAKKYHWQLGNGECRP